jgi:predicted DNA binding protein
MPRNYFDPVLEVRLLVDAPKEWIREVNQGHSAFVKITDLRSLESAETVQNIVEVSSARESAEELIDAISQSKDIKGVDLVRLDPHRIMGMITTRSCPVCSTLAGLNCSLVSASTKDDGRMEWKILISGEDTLKQITDRLESKGVLYTIVGQTHLTAKNDLTARQEQIAKIALELGYFEFPKKIKLEELSERLGISPGTLSEILRRAEKNILSRYFQGHS